MDADRFDRLARALAVARTRRAVAGGVLALVGQLGVAAAGKDDRKRSRRPCPRGQASCPPDGCVDLSSNPRHCGGCGKACDGICCDGFCSECCGEGVACPGGGFCCLTILGYGGIAGFSGPAVLGNLCQECCFDQHCADGRHCCPNNTCHECCSDAHCPLERPFCAPNGECVEAERCLRCRCSQRACKARDGCCSKPDPNSGQTRCVSGAEDTACGRGGNTCVDCTRKGGGKWVCQDRRCCLDDGEKCPPACEKGKPCRQCCSGRCGRDGKCGKCVADGEACPGSCQPDRDCPDCCGGKCNARRKCCSVPGSGPTPAGRCPNTCQRGQDCAACCGSGFCNRDGICF